MNISTHVNEGTAPVRLVLRDVQGELLQSEIKMKLSHRLVYSKTLYYIVTEVILFLQ